MKITGYTPADRSGSKPQGTNTSKTDSNAVQSGASAAWTPGVAVAISSSSRSAAKGAQNVPAVFDAAKVAAVKSAIQNGSYVVNHQAIADKLLAQTQETLPQNPA